MKRCSRCGETKPLDNFSYRRKNGGPRQSACKPCRLEIQREHREANPEKYRMLERKYRERHKDVCNERTRDWRRRNQEQIRQQRKHYQRELKYGITQQQWEDKLREQDYKCAICRRPVEKSGKSTVMDHDHGCCPGARTCGKCLRGILCRHCNLLLGHAGDSFDTLIHAAEYLWNHRRDGQTE